MWVQPELKIIENAKIVKCPGCGNDCILLPGNDTCLGCIHRKETKKYFPKEKS